MPLASVTTMPTPSSLCSRKAALGASHAVVGADEVGGDVEQLKPLAHRRAPRPQRHPVVASAPAACHPAPRWLGYRVGETANEGPRFAPVHLRPLRRLHAHLRYRRQDERPCVVGDLQRAFAEKLQTLKPNATAGSPTTTFAGAARRPSSARPSTASCACTFALVGGGAGSPLPACVYMGSISTPATSAGGATSSSSATPVKSSMYTW
eukprot:6205422-Pleurochrysis_carterae.AAC.1